MKRQKTKFTTDRELKELKPKNKDYALTDATLQGLQIRVKANGKKQWILRYASPSIKKEVKKIINGEEKIYITGKQNNIGLGLYPIISLSEAREKARETNSPKI